MQKETQSLKSLSHSYNVNLNKLYYLSSRKKYSKNKIKKTVFEEKYGKRARMEVNKHVCICGPKISTDLKGNEVMIEEEFITNNMWSDEEDA